MLLCPYREFKSIFRAYLQCQSGRFSVNIDLVYYRYQNAPEADLGDSPEFSQADIKTPNHLVIFEIDDSNFTENGFTYLSFNGDPKPKTNTFTLTNANPFCLRTYSEDQGNYRFKVVFGQYLNRDWVHLEDFLFGTAARIDSEATITRGPDWALSISDAHIPSTMSFGRLWIRHFHLPGSP